LGPRVPNPGVLSGIRGALGTGGKGGFGFSSPFSPGLIHGVLLGPLQTFLSRGGPSTNRGKKPLFSRNFFGGISPPQKEKFPPRNVGEKARGENPRGETRRLFPPPLVLARDKGFPRESFGRLWEFHKGASPCGAKRGYSGVPPPFFLGGKKARGAGKIFFSQKKEGGSPPPNIFSSPPEKKGGFRENKVVFVLR